MTEAEKEARKEAERRYPTLSPHPAEAMYAKSALHHYQQGSFIAGATWEASRAPQPTEDERDWLVGFFLGAGVAPHIAARFALDLLDSGFRRAPVDPAATDDRARRGAPAIERDRLPGYDLDKHSDLL